LNIKQILKRVFFADLLYFYFINLKYKLHLDFKSNKDQLQIFKEVFFHKVYNRLFPFKMQNAVIVDIGAHYGYFTMYAAKNIGQHSKVFAVEPAEKNYINLVKNVEACKLHNINPLKLALAGITSNRLFYTAKDWNNSLFSNYLDHMQEGDNVFCLSISDFMQKYDIQQIDFLKIDCEGAEHEILQKTDQATLQKIKVIAMEIHDMHHCGYESSDTLEKLKMAGFRTEFSNFEMKKHKKGYNAMVVMQNNILNN